MEPRHGTPTAPGPLGIGGALVLAAVLLTAAVSWLLYEHTVDLLTENLRQRLLSIATTQAANLDPADLAALRTEADWQSPAWARVVGQLKRAKDGNPNIVFMYVFRRKPDDPGRLEFVADAGSLDPYANTDADPTNDVDANGDGRIEPAGADQLQWPGQDYPTPPAEAFSAFDGPLTNRDLYADAYGQVLTGYAPVRDAAGNTVAVLGTDIKADDFLAVTRQTLYPFLLFIVFLGLAIVALATVLIRLWQRRVDLFAELDRQKDEVLGILGHQLQAPISAVKWTLEMLRAGDYTQAESAGIIRDQAAALEQLATMILETSRIQLGSLPIRKAPLDLDAFFRAVLETVAVQAAQKKVRLEVSLPAALPTVLLDGKYARMTVENVLSNAVKYTPAGGRVDFTVTIEHGVLCCTVRDTGIGIPTRDQDRLFSKMYRASNVAESDSMPGNGLGLYAARGAIEAQGGRIRFDSEEGKGTTFFIEVPVQVASQTTPADRTEPGQRKAI